MERKKYIIIILLFFIITGETKGCYKMDIYRSFISGDMVLWKSVIDEMASVSKHIDMTAELVNYQYGYIAWCIGNSRYDEAKRYLEKAEKNLRILEKEERNLSSVNSYRSAFYGYRIGMNHLLAPVIGIKSIDCAREAIRLDDKDPFAYVQNGNIEFYRPSVFGGSKSEAIKYYLKALQLMEADSALIKENWNYLSLLTVIAQAYSYMDDYDLSVLYLKKILEIEPDFVWVRNELYPQIVKKMEK